MSEKPVAWMREIRGFSGPDMPDEYDTHITTIDPKDARYTALYSQSPAEARALAIAECARIAAKHIREPDGSEFCAGESLGAKQIEKEIRALSSPPSVTEEWIMDVESKVYETGADPVRATLAALGVTVEGAAK